MSGGRKLDLLLDFRESGHLLEFAADSRDTILQYFPSLSWMFNPAGCAVFPRPLQIQPQQTLKDHLLCYILRHLIFRPAIRIPHRAVERGVQVLQPGGALVVEVGEGALFSAGSR